jgi:hypothetical protein
MQEREDSAVELITAASPDQPSLVYNAFNSPAILSRLKDLRKQLTAENPDTDAERLLHDRLTMPNSAFLRTLEDREAAQEAKRNKVLESIAQFRSEAEQLQVNPSLTQRLDVARTRFGAASAKRSSLENEVQTAQAAGTPDTTKENQLQIAAKAELKSKQDLYKIEGQIEVAAEKRVAAMQKAADISAKAAEKEKANAEKANDQWQEILHSVRETLAAEDRQGTSAVATAERRARSVQEQTDRALAKAAEANRLQGLQSLPLEDRVTAAQQHVDTTKQTLTGAEESLRVDTADRDRMRVYTDAYKAHTDAVKYLNEVQAQRTTELSKEALAQEKLNKLRTEHADTVAREEAERGTGNKAALTQAQNKIAQLESEIQALEARRTAPAQTGTTDSAVELKQRKLELDKQIEATEKQIRENQDRINASLSDEVSLERRIASLQAEREEAQKRTAELADRRLSTSTARDQDVDERNTLRTQAVAGGLFSKADAELTAEEKLLLEQIDSIEKRIVATAAEMDRLLDQQLDQRGREYNISRDILALEKQRRELPPVQSGDAAGLDSSIAKLQAEREALRARAAELDTAARPAQARLGQDDAQLDALRKQAAASDVLAKEAAGVDLTAEEKRLLEQIDAIEKQRQASLADVSRLADLRQEHLNRELAITRELAALDGRRKALPPVQNVDTTGLEAERKRLLSSLDDSVSDRNQVQAKLSGITPEATPDDTAAKQLDAEMALSATSYRLLKTTYRKQQAVLALPAALTSYGTA